MELTARKWLGAVCCVLGWHLLVDAAETGQTVYWCVGGAAHPGIYFVPVAGLKYPNEHYAQFKVCNMQKEDWENQEDAPISLSPPGAYVGENRLPKPDANPPTVTLTPTERRQNAGQCKINIYFQMDKTPDGEVKRFTTVDDWCVGRVDIVSIDDRFAPSVENCDIFYSMVPSNFQAPNAKIEIFTKDDLTCENPIYRSTSIAKAGTYVLHQWDGKANLGENTGKYSGPDASPYFALISVSDKTDFSDGNQDGKDTKVEIHSIDLTPDGDWRLFKPGIIDSITAAVSIKMKDDSGVATELPIRVDWSFEDPDDTATSIIIDPNGAVGDDNCPVDKGGKRGPESIMWMIHAEYMGGINKNVAWSWVRTTGDAKGKTGILFAASGIAGDNYILVAQVKDSSGTSVPKEKKSGTWTVWRDLIFLGAYNMNGGIDAGDVMRTDNIRPAFSGDGCTEYEFAGSQPLPAGDQSPEYVVPLSNPTEEELPTNEEKANLNAVLPTGEPDVATQEDAVARIHMKAQHWHDRNRGEQHRITSLDAYAQLIGANAYSVIGARYYHPKMDGLEATGATDHYCPGDARISIYVPGGTIHPDAAEWGGPIIQGLCWGKVVYIFLNSGDATRRQIVGRHEAGHASDHESFGPDGHAASGLMHENGQSNQFSDDSILRLRGWWSNP